MSKVQQARKVSKANRPATPVQPTRGPFIRPQPEKRLKKAKLLLIVATCFVLSLVVVAQYSSLVILNYRLGTARSELVAVEESSRMLELEVARLASVSRIDEIAREELGMVEPEADQVRVFSAALRESNRSGE